MTNIDFLIKNIIKKFLKWAGIVIVFLFCNCFFFKTGKADSAIQGRIYIAGNEPFARIAIEKDNGDVYYLKCKEQIKKKLWDLQGKKIVVNYVEIKENKAGKFIIVKSYKLINNKEE